MSRLFAKEYEAIRERGYGVLEATSAGALKSLKEDVQIPEDLDGKLMAEWERVAPQAIAFPPTAKENRLSCGPYVLLVQPLMVGTKPPSDAPKEIRAYDYTRPKVGFREVFMDRDMVAPLVIRGRVWWIIANKFPWVKQMIFMSRFWRPQILYPEDILDFLTVQKSSKILGFFNGWSAGASVNHFHLQVHYEDKNLLSLCRETFLGRSGSVDVGTLNHPEANLAFRSEDPRALALAVGEYVRELRERNVPHNVHFMGDKIVVFPRNNDPKRDVSRLFAKTGRHSIVAGLDQLGLFGTWAKDVRELVDVAPEDVGAFFRASELKPALFVAVTKDVLGAEIGQALASFLDGPRPLVPNLESPVTRAMVETMSEAQESLLAAERSL